MKIIRNAVRHRDSSRLKITLRMKLLLSLFFATLLQINANLEGNRSQNITLDLKSATVLDVIREIETTTDYRFLYRKDQLDTSRKMDIRAKNEKLERILQKVFGNSGISYKIEQKQIVLTPNDDMPSGPAANLTTPNQEQHTVTGTVTDAQGPMPGVSIYIKDSDRGTFSDVNGNYQISASTTDVLVFSYIGYRTQERVVGYLARINVELQEDITELNEVVLNAGYYTTTEKVRTGNIIKVTSKEVELQPLVSPLQALQGRVAGMEVTPGGDLPGAAPTIRIRGQNSLRDEGNYPLYIIDGMPINSTPVESNNSKLTFTGIDPLSTLNLSNIESIEVLKDADATAIYGSRGANGVILITTKKGIAQKTAFQARIYSGVSTVPNRLDLLNTKQYLQIRNRAFENDGVEPTTRNAYDLLLWDQNRETDWQDVFWGGNAWVTNANLSASGGNANTQFQINGGYQEQGTIYPGNSKYEKATVALSLNHSTKDQKLSLGLKLNYGMDINNLVGSSGSQIISLSPNAPAIFNEDGSLHWEEWAEASINNPFQGYFNASKTEANNLISNLNLNYKILNNLSFSTSLGFTNLNSKELIKVPKRSYNPSSWQTREHRSDHLIGHRKSWIIEPQLNYNTHLGNLQIDGLIGTTFQQSQNNQTGVTGSGYVSEALIGNLAAAETLTQGVNQTTDYRYHAVFGRLGLNWNQKYFLNLTGRRDGSSRFGPGKRWANFGAIGAAWIFSEENWVREHLKFLSFGKLRGSYGTTGNDQIGDYGYLDAYEATVAPGGLYPTALANPDYSWEVNKKLETGVQLGFLKDRINLGASWYRNRSSNQLVGYPLPGTTGFSMVQANLPATVQNTGWELEFSSSNFRSNDFNWHTSFNVSFPKNKLVSYPGLDESSYANTYRVGHPLNIALLYQYVGVDPETGLYSIEDVNVDGRYDFEDRVIIKDQNRQFFGGINNTLNYKKISLQFLWQFVKQEGNLALFDVGRYGAQRAFVAEALDDGSPFQNISQSIGALLAYLNVQNSDLIYSDASFIRLKTLSLSYTLPASPLQTIGIDECKIFVNGQNLFTLTGYDGMDAEFATGAGTGFGNLRIITAGLQLNF
ncbi:SusC/RagA family TonB-linked outer membrane protein [Sinomicrobium oceani]|uniref:SusC/RagA family TonB-linked outer membrane protein n=1 Tax=Sinomicrobium oceani TaxID=1150368 RepID=UPI00227C02BB|nr:SusC/RagA family TonB-linked outer membrane protein [Sinomicrobium oceani]